MRRVAASADAAKSISGVEHQERARTHLRGANRDCAGFGQKRKGTLAACPFDPYRTGQFSEQNIPLSEWRSQVDPGFCARGSCLHDRRLGRWCRHGGTPCLLDNHGWCSGLGSYLGPYLGPRLRQWWRWTLEELLQRHWRQVSGHDRGLVDGRGNLAVSHQHGKRDGWHDPHISSSRAYPAACRHLIECEVVDGGRRRRSRN
jgi:hypothetical protein